jgi:hypothetical protein
MVAVPWILKANENHILTFWMRQTNRAWLLTNGARSIVQLLMVLCNTHGLKVR